MIYRRIPIILLLAVALLAGCEKDPLSDKGKIKLPQKSAQETAQNTTQPSAPTTDTEGTTREQQLDNTPAEMPINETEYKTLGWDDLLPESLRPDQELIDKYNRGEVGDDDPQIIALKKQMRELVEQSPINTALEGQRVRLPGFVVPLESDGKKVSEFLLVPYQGACIHVPPPPPNQTVLVQSKNGTSAVRELFDTVWVSGTIRVEHNSKSLADTGYTFIADNVETYDE